MGADQFDQFLNFASILCVVMAVVNALLYKRRGVNALLLAGAFLALAGTLRLLLIGASNMVVGAAAFVLVALLVADFLLRSQKQVEGKGKRR